MAGFLAVSGCLPLHAEPVGITERQKLLQQAASNPARHGVWASDTYHDIKDERAGLQQNARTNSLTLGYDQRVTPRWTAGLALTQLSQRSELLQDDTRRRGSGLLASLYGAYAPLPFLTFPVSLGLGQIRTSQNRVAEGQELQGRFSSNLTSASAGMTLMVPLQSVFLSNSLQLSYDSGQIGSFVERWPGQQVATPAQKTSSTQWHLSTKASVWIDGKLWPYVSLKYSHDLQRTPGEDDDDQLQWGLGLDVLQRAGWTGGLGYARVAGRQGIGDQSLTLTVRKSY
ncbi:MAG: autotransporter outer membrane beta-barrel domain-containing protein [Thiobacillus sp.]|nr:autotransporter outer membrane beta-barrel domain-containing protein [Thiobacillus sp.]